MMLARRVVVAARTLAPARGMAVSARQGRARQVLREVLDDIKAAGTWKTERVITSPQSASISVQGRPKQVLNFCANNYLGLSSHPRVLEAAHEALRTHGNGLSSVRFICGTQDLHKQLEGQIRQFHGTDDAILFPSCFDANAGLFEVLLSPEDAVLSDELNHASIIDGIRLCKAQKARYKHRDMADLEEHLQRLSSARLKLIVTDGVFSMDGNIAPLREICDLADKYDALVFIDECHATGLLGPTGRGTPEYLGLEPGRVDIINSTMGKALGGAMGGYTTGPQELIDLLRQKARPYLFSNTLPPAVVGATIEVFNLLMNDSSLVAKLQHNTQRFRSKMQAAGFKVGGDPEHPICPIHLGDARLATEFADEMLEKGVFVIGFSFPVVPKGKARIRVQISAGHSEEDIDFTVQAFTDVARSKGLLP